MADFTPVGNTIIPPNPNQTLQTLSGILGMKQQQQALQQGQQTIALNSQKIAQGAIETQAQQEANSFFQGWNPGAHHDDGGVIDIGSAHDTPGYQNLSGAGRLKVDTALNGLQQQQLQNKQFATSLTADVNAAGGKLAMAAAADPSSAPQLFANFAQQGPQYQAWVNRFGDLAKKSSYNPDALRTIAAQSLDVIKQAPQPGSLDIGGNILPTTVSPLTGIQTPTGQQFNKTLAPQVYSPPGGGPQSVIGGGYGTGGTTKPPSGVPGPQPAASDWEKFGNYNESLNSRVQVASDLLPRLKLTETAADAIRTGAGTETRASMAKALQAAGAPQGLVDSVAGGNLASVQEAEKMMFQTTMSGLKQAMQGDPSRVAEFQAAEKVFPNVSTDPRARQQILGFMSDQGQRDFAEQQALNKSRTEGSFNPVTWQGDYQKQLRSGNVPGVPASQVPTPAGQSAKTVNRTGTVKNGPNKGKTVTEYSDGSREYK